MGRAQQLVNLSATDDLCRPCFQLCGRALHHVDKAREVTGTTSRLPVLAVLVAQYGQGGFSISTRTGQSQSTTQDGETQDQLALQVQRTLSLLVLCG